MDEHGTKKHLDWWAVGLWASQLILAAIFLYAGFMKLGRSPEGLAELGWTWAMDLPLPFIRFIGAMEILGAVGIILPAASRILPWLTPLAAAGMAFVQISAIILHGARGETAETVWFNLTLLALSAFVLWGRLSKRPVSPRT